jgi:hypothetical protein
VRHWFGRERFETNAADDGASISCSSVSDSFKRYEFGVSLNWDLDRLDFLSIRLISRAGGGGRFRRIEMNKV